LIGFKKFCEHNKYTNEVVKKIGESDIKKGVVFIVFKDTDLVYLVKKIRDMNLLIGVDVGIISYNDTPLKEVVADGITTISTDFELMGKTLAKMVLNKINNRIENPSSLIIRKSL